MAWRPSYFSLMLRKKFRRHNYHGRNIRELEQDLNEAWAELRAERLKRWVITAGLIVLWEIIKALLT